MSNNEFITPSQTPKQVSVTKPSSPTNRSPVRPLNTTNLATKLATKLHAVAKTRKNNARAAHALAHIPVYAKGKHAIQSPTGRSAANLHWRKNVPSSPKHDAKIPSRHASPKAAAASAAIDGTSLAILLVSDPEFLGCMFESIQHAANQCRSGGGLFRPQDLTMIGGSVLTMYNHLLERYRARHPIPQLVNFFERGTTDMDLTWWMANSPFVPSSNRTAVFDVGEELIKRMRMVFKDKHQLLALKEIIGRIMQQPDVHVSIEDINYYKPPRFTTMKTFVEAYGSYSIKIMIRINQTIIDICEITIHDGHSSQQLNDLHQPQTPHLFGSITDPTYCTSGQPPVLLTNTMMISTGSNKQVRVPILAQYITQQLFSCINLLLRDNEKGYLCLKRITYLLRLLTDPVQHAENIVNIRKIIWGPFPLFQIIELFLNKLMQKLQILYTHPDRPDCINVQDRLVAALNPIGVTMRVYLERIGILDYIMTCRNPGVSIAPVPLDTVSPQASKPVSPKKGGTRKRR